MKPSPTNHATLVPAFRRLAALTSIGIAASLAALSVTTQAADWNGSTSIDWNTAANWSTGLVPNNDGAYITTSTGNIATLSASPTGTITELQVGTWYNTGRLDHTAGSLSITNSNWPYGWLLLGGGSGGTGTYNIANTAASGGAFTGFGTGSGSLTVNGEMRIGAGSWWDHATGVLNVNTSGTIQSNGTLIAGTNIGDVGTVNIDAGAFTVFGDYTNSAQFGSGGSAATGNLNISGGSFTVNNRLTLGVGTGSSAGGNVATVTMSGGTLTTDVGHNEDWHAGVNMASGYDTATGGTATFNLNGGTLSTQRVFSETGGTGIKGTSTFNFNGGTLQAQDSRTNFIDGLTRANVRNGGAVVNTNGFDVSITQALLHSNVGGDNATDGGLTKNGAGVLTLNNVDNSFTGNITVNTGTLRANGFRGGYLATTTLGANDGSRTITVNSGANLDLTSNNIFAGSGATAGGVPQIVLNGGLMQSNDFNAIGHVTLNGGVLNQASGSFNGNYEGYEFLGNITVGGTSASTISSSNGKANHIAGGNNMLVTVADATSSSAADLIISNPLRDGSGDYSGNGALTKAGAGTLLLTASNTYSGGTTVSAGTLEVNNTTGSGTGSGTVTVDTGAKLSGDGSITAGTNNYVYLNGTLQVGAIGASAGSDFSVTTSGSASTVFGASSLLAMDLWSTTGTDMTSTQAAADMLRLFGTLDITAGATLLLNNPNALTFTAGDVFKVIDWTGLTTRTGTWTLDTSAIIVPSGAHVDTSNLYTQGTISILGVPEPSRAMLAMLGVVGLLMRRRRVFAGFSPHKHL